MKLIPMAVAFVIVGPLEAGETYVDPRDGERYETVALDGQTWLAESLRFVTEGSWLYMDDPLERWHQTEDHRDAATYGRLYTWDAAQEACPEGWRLPSLEDYQGLIEALGGRSKAAARLKSGSEHWVSSPEGAEASGFGAEPAGGRINFGWYFYRGEKAYFWSSTDDEDDDERAHGIELDRRHDQVFGDYGYRKTTGFSVRCVRGER